MRTAPRRQTGSSLARPRVPRGESCSLICSLTHLVLPLFLRLQTGGQATETQKLLVGTIFLNTFFFR